MGKREELLKLKEKYWEKEDYGAVKKIRLAIKEYDKLHPLPRREYREIPFNELGKDMVKEKKWCKEFWEEMYEAEEDLEKKLEMLVEAHEKGWIE